MSELVELLRGIFTRQGFEVRNLSTGNVLAKNAGDSILVHCAHLPLDQVRVAALNNERVETGAMRGVVIDLTEGHLGIEPTGFETWPRERFIAEVGAAVVEYAIGAIGSPDAPTPPAAPSRGVPTVPVTEPTQFRSLVARASTGSEYARLGVHFLPSKPTRSAEPVSTGVLPNAFSGAAAAMAPNASLTRDDRRARDAVAMPMDGRSRATRQAEAEQAAAHAAHAAQVAQAAAVAQQSVVERPSPATSGGDAPRTAMIRGKEVNLEPNEDVEIIISSRSRNDESPMASSGANEGQEPAVLKPIVTKTTATEIAQQQVGRVKRASLELVPHHAFTYNLNLVVDGLDAPIAGRGAVLANAVTGALVEVPELQYTTRSMEHAQVTVAQLDTASVYGKAKSHLTKRFTRDVKITRTIEDVEMEEAKRIVPTPLDLNIESAGTVLAPVYVIEGENGTIEVDAFVE